MLQDMKLAFPKHVFLGSATQIDKPFEEITESDFIGELLVIGFRPDLGIVPQETEMRWFSSTPKVPTSKYENCRYARGVFFAAFDSPCGRLAVFCSHYDDFSVDARSLAVRVESEFIEEKAQPGDFIIAMGDRNTYPDAKGPEHIQELLERTKLSVGRSPTRHLGLDGTWIGWESDPFSAPLVTDPFVDSMVATLDGTNRSYDMILTNRTPLWSIHHPGQFKLGQLVPIEITDFNCSTRLCASDHAFVCLGF